MRKGGPIYAYGTASKFQPDAVQRDPLVFATTHGHFPWSDHAPEAIRMNERSRQMIAAKDEELKLQALAAAGEKAPVIIDAKADSEEPAETLEAVVPPPEPPETFGGGGSRR